MKLLLCPLLRKTWAQASILVLSEVVAEVQHLPSLSPASPLSARCGGWARQPPVAAAVVRLQKSAMEQQQQQQQLLPKNVRKGKNERKSALLPSPFPLRDEGE